MSRKFYSRHCPCPDCTERRIAREIAILKALAAALVIGVACLFFLFGCNSTVTPGIVTPPTASYSGNLRNSGIIAHSSAGWVVDESFRARYNALIAIYGREYGLTPDAGMIQIVTGPPGSGWWLIDRQHFDLMVTMNVKKHSGIAPKP